MIPGWLERRRPIDTGEIEELCNQLARRVAEAIAGGGVELTLGRDARLVLQGITQHMPATPERLDESPAV